MELVSDSPHPNRESLHLFPAFILFFPGAHMEEDQDKPPGNELTQGPEVTNKAKGTKNKTVIKA